MTKIARHPTGPLHYSPGGQMPSSSAFGGFPPPASTSPFLNFDAQQTSMGDIFPMASQLQPTTSPPASGLGNWGSGSGTGIGSGILPQQSSDQGRTSHVRPRQALHAWFQGRRVSCFGPARYVSMSVLVNVSLKHFYQVSGQRYQDVCREGMISNAIWERLAGFLNDCDMCTIQSVHDADRGSMVIY